jgi:hypothetical protein
MRLGAAVLAVIILGGCSATLPAPEAALDQAALPSPAPQQCVPYARQVSGIELHGDAWTWWEGAAGRFERGSRPLAGSVLVLRRSERLRWGHLAVVTAIDGPRRIRLTHTNWGNDPETRRRVYRDMTAMDVSPDNRWTEIRFWNREAGAYGRPYPAHGFIYRQAAPI